MPNPLTILPPVQNRDAAYAGVLSQILSMRQANQQQAAAAAQAEEDQRTNAVKAALTPYAGQPQLMALALQKLAPEDQQRAQKAGFGIVPPMESPEQVLNRAKATAQTNDITGQQAPAPPPVQPAAPPPPTATGQSVVDSAIGNAPDQPPPSAPPAGPPAAPPPPTMVSSANAVIDAENRHSLAVYGKELSPEYVKRRYTELLQGPDALVKADQIETKTAPTAQEAITNAANDRTFNQVTKPKTDAEIANLGSEVKYRDTVQTPNTRATTAHTQAETVKAGAETQKIGEEVKALRQSNDPVVRAVIGKSLAQGIIDDPQSWFSPIPKEDRQLIFNVLHRAPSKLNSDEVGQINASVNGLHLLNDARNAIDEMAKLGYPVLGPFLGRYEEASNKFGDTVYPPGMPDAIKPKWANAVAKTHEWLTILPVLESKGLIGSRPPKEIINRIASVTPSLSKSVDFFNGSMAGTEQRLQERQQTLTAKQWGGKPPVLDGGASTNPTDLKSKSNTDLFKMLGGGS